MRARPTTLEGATGKGVGHRREPRSTAARGGPKGPPGVRGAVLGDGDEVVALATTLVAREIAQAGPRPLARDGAEDEAVARAVVVRDDRNPVDPLSDLALVHVDEGRDLDACVDQNARVKLPDRAGAPHDGRPPAQRVLAQV